MKKKTINKIESWSKIISFTIIPIVIGVIGFVINKSIEDSKLNARYIEIGIRILQDNDSDPLLNEYAVNLINEFAPIPIKNDVKEKLINGELTFPSDMLESIERKRHKQHLTKVNSDPVITKWINQNKPFGANVKLIFGYENYDYDNPYSIIIFQIDGENIGKGSQWWFSEKTVLKAEGFYKNGRNSGWWNFYNKDGNYEISRFYDSTKYGIKSLIKSSKSGPMKISNNYSE